MAGVASGGSARAGAIATGLGVAGPGGAGSGVPGSDEVDAGEVSSGATAGPAAPLRYERKGAGWEPFQCVCRKVIQLSPVYMGRTMTCAACGRSIEIAGGQTANRV